LLRSRNKLKYVNMADIISEACETSRADASEDAVSSQPDHARLSQDELYWYVEALFFAYRDFTGDPDRILNEIGFGRAHHRVLHFVHRYPGMRVADLLEILQITKQSLARVLRELIKEDYIAQHSGESDRRARLLYATERGVALARRLAAPQLEKLGAALSASGRDGNLAVAHFLNAMISSEALIAGGRTLFGEAAPGERRAKEPRDR
jgi:DNA-binding MarR family transcriptional regulator